ncbi:hypothetical protein [Parvibaculum sedimenti]|nr:hypothetical protein [Parvibaculum sedimenti]
MPKRAGDVDAFVFLEVAMDYLDAALQEGREDVVLDMRLLNAAHLISR